MTSAARSALLAVRPKTLTAALVPLVVSTALTHTLGRAVDWSVVGLAGMASFLIQIATNLFNDAIDFAKGADTEARIGPARVTQRGLISGRAVMNAAILCVAGALLCGVPLVVKGGVPILAIGIVSLVLAYAYTGGPHPLAYRGLGDLFVVLFFGIIAVSGLVYLHTGEWLISATVAGAQVGFLATVLLAINNARDIEGDRAAQKWTLPARFGITFARWEIALLFGGAYLLNLYWSSVYGWWSVWGTLLALPLVVSVMRLVWRTPPSPLYNEALGQAAKAHLLFGGLLAIGMVIGW